VAAAAVGLVAVAGWWCGPAGAAEPAADAAQLPETVTRLDAEKERIRQETREAEARVAAVRRAGSDFERRRQEVLRALEAERATLATREQAAAAEIATLRAGVVERDAEIEHVLRAGGRWVSFTHDVAPLLRARCVACHTAREPGGGHVLTHHAALLADAGGGAAVVPGDVDSPLVRAVADGSMPKDGDPLSAAEVDLLRRWVALGARLDGGADAEAALIRIMPRMTQPRAPATYAAPVPVSALAFHPDGTRLASAGYHEVLVWSVPDGHLLGRITDVAERVHGLAWHPDGRRLAVAAGTPGSFGEATLVDADTAALHAALGAADDALLAVAFSADGSRLVSAGADPFVRIHDTTSLREATTRADHADWVQAAAFSADGKLLLTASRDQTAKVLDIATGRLLTTFSAHQQPVNAACWLPGATTVASGGGDGAVRIWDAATGKETRRIGGFTGSVDVLVPVGADRIAAGDRSGTVRVHAVADGKKVVAFDTGRSPLVALAVSPDGRLLAAGSLDGVITLVPLDGPHDVPTGGLRDVPTGGLREVPTGGLRDVPPGGQRPLVRWSARPGSDR
jgi:hypothetical protein